MGLEGSALQGHELGWEGGGLSKFLSPVPKTWQKLQDHFFHRKSALSSAATLPGVLGKTWGLRLGPTQQPLVTREFSPTGGGQAGEAQGPSPLTRPYKSMSLPVETLAAQPGLSSKPPQEGRAARQRQMAGTLRDQPQRSPSVAACLPPALLPPWSVSC